MSLVTNVIEILQDLSDRSIPCFLCQKKSLYAVVSGKGICADCVGPLVGAKNAGDLTESVVEAL